MFTPKHICTTRSRLLGGGGRPPRSCHPLTFFHSVPVQNWALFGVLPLKLHYDIPLTSIWYYFINQVYTSLNLLYVLEEYLIFLILKIQRCIHLIDEIILVLISPMILWFEWVRPVTLERVDLKCVAILSMQILKWVSANLHVLYSLTFIQAGEITDFMIQPYNMHRCKTTTQQSRIGSRRQNKSPWIWNNHHISMPRRFIHSGYLMKLV